VSNDCGRWHCLSPGSRPSLQSARYSERTAAAAHGPEVGMHGARASAGSTMTWSPSTVVRSPQLAQ
jgi:hypothetical protein